jgi:transglutaminase-like putative cysteine protease
VSLGAPVIAARPPESGALPRSAGSWLAFGALAFYATLRWGTMLEGSEQGRLFASLLLTLLLAGLVRALTRRRRLRWAIAPVLIAAALGLVALAGFPLSPHVGRIGSALSDGAGTFGDLLVPYDGGDPNVAAALVLSGGLLLLGAAVAFGSVTGSPGTARLALAAAPLLALAVVPSTIVTPRLAYVHGLVTFALIALLVFSPRLVPEARGSAIALLGLVAVLGAVGAGVIAGDRLWVARNASGGTGGGAAVSGPASAESFNWKQTYGTLGWPYTGTSVLEITAPRPAHWKAEDLDRFDGRGWTQGSVGADPGLAGVSAARRAADSETLEVNVDQITSDQVISAGYSARPDLAGVRPGTDPGTWLAGDPLSPGEDYSVRVYAPDPTAAQLASAGSDYPATLAGFRSLALPAGRYAQVESLAQRLHGRTHNPYGYVEAVLDYLQHGYVYTLDPPPGGAYPLIDFLLHSRRGYCQQFAGAMALLLRMEAIPARVAVGFSPGQRRPGSHTYVVADSDAHAWVEVWFPGYGWVTFDPTPGTATAAGSTPAAAAGASAISSRASTPTATTPTSSPAPIPIRPRSSRLTADAGGGAPPGSAGGPSPARTLEIIALAALAAVVLALAAVMLRRFWHAPSPAELTAELERAFSVAGQRLDADVTLADLQRLLADSPAAAGYVGALSAARYGPGKEAPSVQGRAALRRWLAQGTGAGGRLRALAALPPRRRPGRA